MVQPGADTPREIEVKLAIASAEEGRSRLASAGFAECAPRTFESNTVYDTTSLVLRQSRHLLRLRDFAGAATLTWKGTPAPGPHKSREELETTLGDPAAFHQILLRLGYQPQFRYEKYRTTFHLPGQPGLAVLDETPIGCFLELEGSPEWIDKNSLALEFTVDMYITESYASLYARYCDAQGIPFTHMVFGTTAGQGTK